MVYHRFRRIAGKRGIGPAFRTLPAWGTVEVGGANEGGNPQVLHLTVK